MTTNSQSRQLRRRSSNRIVAGVCSGLADYTGVDVAIIRLVTVVLSVFGGAGLPLYLAAWLLIPLEGQTQSAAERLFNR